ncbi:MAG: Holliday junction DNA helicase RuvB C-terminal domain-containing protein, partial [Candidatus Pacebacteria bacterium]|nr:Holliday junction DNA helicase RuvB C-terminal domain-containing protein [Candidatus Paceibacterota bacterium]
KPLKVDINDEAVKIIAGAARFTPRLANRLLKRARDFSEVNNIATINKDAAEKTLEMMSIDNLGLEPTDRQLLETIIKKFHGGPVGIQTLAAAMNDDKGIIEDVYEPFLMSIGLLLRTPSGRVVTPACYKHLGLKVPEDGGLF